MSFFGNRRAAAPVKQFMPPAEFEYNWLLALRLMACESRGDFSCYITAGNGVVTLHINGLENMESLVRTYAPGAYQHFFRHPTYKGGSLQMTFHEPDCYIFGCPQKGLEWDLQELAPNAVVTDWREVNGMKQISVRFAPFSSELETERWDAFVKYYSIWLQ